ARFESPCRATWARVHSVRSFDPQLVLVIDPFGALRAADCQHDGPADPYGERCAQATSRVREKKSRAPMASASAIPPARISVAAVPCWSAKSGRQRGPYPFIRKGQV